MIKLIVGEKGSGKTKALVEKINAAVKSTQGNVVVIEKGMQLTYNIDINARLINMDDYKITGYEMLTGFISGVLASNYDIKELFVDGMMRVGGDDLAELGRVLDSIAPLVADIETVITVSADASKLPESVKKYL